MSSFRAPDGREINTDEFLREVVSLAQLLATNARLLEPLPANTDLTQDEQKEIQTQIHAILVLPPRAIGDFWSAFAAHHLGALASALRELSPATQKQAISTLIQILSLLPEPKDQPYVRRFIRSSQANGLPSLVAGAFVQGITWLRPSGPGKLCTFIINLLFWCDTNQGDDAKASIDAGIRSALASKLDALMTTDTFNQLEGTQRTEVRRLRGVLNAIEQMPSDVCLKSTREQLEGQLEICQKPSCGEDPDLTCSRCKSVRYCGKACQTWDWKNGHKSRCFQTAY